MSRGTLSASRQDVVIRNISQHFVVFNRMSIGSLSASRQDVVTRNMSQHFAGCSKTPRGALSASRQNVVMRKHRLAFCCVQQGVTRYSECVTSIGCYATPVRGTPVRASSQRTPPQLPLDAAGCPHLDATPLSPILAKIQQVSGEPLVPTCIHLPRPQSGAQIFQVRCLLPRTVSANSWRTLTSEYPVRAEGWVGGWVGGERMGRGHPQPRTRKSEEDGGLEVGMGEQMGGKHEFRAAEVPLSVIEARPIAVTPATNQLGIWSLSFCALSHHTPDTPTPTTTTTVASSSLLPEI